VRPQIGTFTTQNDWDGNLVPSFTGCMSTLTFATGALVIVPEPEAPALIGAGAMMVAVPGAGDPLLKLVEP